MLPKLLRAIWAYLMGALATTHFDVRDTFSRRGGYVGEPYYLKPVPFAISQGANGVIPFLIFVFHGSSHLHSLAAALLGFKISVGSALSAFLVSRYFPILINEKGMRARNWVGVARRIEWGEVIAVKKIRWLYIAPVVRISVKQEKNHILLPLFLEKQEAFSAQVRAWTPPDNLLHQFFEAEARLAQQQTTEPNALSSEDVALR